MGVPTFKNEEKAASCTFFGPLFTVMLLCFLGVALCFIHLASSHDLRPFSLIDFGALLSKIDDFVASFVTSRSNRL